MSLWADGQVDCAVVHARAFALPTQRDPIRVRWLLVAQACRAECEQSQLVFARLIFVVGRTSLRSTAVLKSWALQFR